jgi:hypothetical protein
MTYGYLRLREAAGRLLMYGRRWHAAARSGDAAAARRALKEFDARVPPVVAAAQAYAGPRPPGVMAEFVAGALAYHGAATPAQRAPFLDLVRELCRTPTIDELLAEPHGPFERR